MTPKQKEKLEKVFALYNDSAARQTGESKAAEEALRRLCAQYKVDFEEYMKSKGVDVKGAEETHSQSSARISRRAFIILRMAENVWDKETLAEAICIAFPDKYADLKRNKQAVSGTIYDLQTNGKADIKVCDLTGRIVYSLLRKKR